MRISEMGVTTGGESTTPAIPEVAVRPEAVELIGPIGVLRYLNAMELVVVDFGRRTRGCLA